MAGRVRVGTAYIDVRLGSFSEFKKSAEAAAMATGKQVANKMAKQINDDARLKNVGKKIASDIGQTAANAAPSAFQGFKNKMSSIMNSSGVQSSKDFFRQFSAGVGSLFSGSSQKFQFASAAFKASGSSAANAFTSAFNSVGPKVTSLLQSAASGAISVGSRIASGIASGFGSLKNGLDKLGSSLQTFSQRLGLTSFMVQNLGIELTLLATGPVVALAGALSYFGIKAAVNLQQATAGLAPFVGGIKNAQAEVKTLADIAAKSPAFNTEDVITYAKKLQAAGVTQKNTIALFKSLSNIFTTLGVDTEGAGRSFNAIVQIMQKGKVTAEEVTQQLGEQIPAWKLLAEGMNLPIAQVQKMASEGKISGQQFVDAMIRVGQTKTYTDGAGQGADTLKARFESLKEQVQFRLAIAFEKYLFPVLEDLSDKYGPKITSFFEGLANRYLPAVARGIQRFADTLQGLKDGYDALDPKAKAFIGKFALFIIALGPAVLIISRLGAALSTMGAVLAFIVSNPILAVLIGAIAALAYAALKARDAVKQFLTENDRGARILEGFGKAAEGVKGIFDKLQPVVEGFFKFAGQAFDGFFGKSQKAADNLKVTPGKGSAGKDKEVVVPPETGTMKAFRELRGYLEDIAKIINDRVVPAVNIVKDKFQEWMKDKDKVLFLKSILISLVIVFAVLVTAIAAVISVAAVVFGALVAIVSDALGGIVLVVSGIVQVIKGIFTGNFGAIKDGVKTIMQGLAQAIFGVLGDIISGIAGIFVTLWQVITAPFRKAYDVLVGHSIVPDLVNAVVAWFRSLPGKIGSAIASLPGQIASIFRQMLANAVSTVSSMVSSVVSTVSGLGGKIRNAIGNLAGLLVSAGRDVINGLISGIGDKTGELLGKAAALGSRIKDTISGVLKIHSPSRVMKVIGTQIVAGLVLGMTPAPVVNQANALASAAIPNPGAFHGGYATSAGNSFAAPAGDINITNNISQPVDPDTVADKTVRRLTSALANRTVS